MFLLYVDDSGSIDDPAISHFVLSGIAVFERQTYWLSQEIEKIAARFNESDPGAVELHGNPMFQGNKGWRRYPREARLTAMEDALKAFSRSAAENRIFAVIIEKQSIEGDDPAAFAFELLCNRFDRYLGRLHRYGNTQRGLMIMDESDHERKFQGLARDFTLIGHRWGSLRNFADVPLFVDSRASRLIQLADLVAYSIFRKYEKADPHLFDLIADRFDTVGQQTTGLVHWRRQPDRARNALTLEGQDPC